MDVDDNDYDEGRSQKRTVSLCDRSAEMTCNNTHLDLVNIIAYTKCGKILSISSKDIELNHNSDINQGP